jgi:LuxR family transcriptional regulator, glucitol operon activator
MPSASSQMAYVLLWAVEEDLRDLIQLYSEGATSVDVLGSSLTERAVKRRHQDKRTSAEHLAGLLPYIDFQDAFDIVMRNSDRLPDDLARRLQILHTSVAGLALVRNRVAHNRPLEIDDLPKVLDFIETLVATPGFEWDNSAETLKEVKADPGYIYKVEARLITDPSTAIANNLPPPDFDETSLLGRREERRQVKRALMGAWPVITILGDGGIGKTALALQVSYDLVDSSDCPFEAVVWVSAKNSELTSTEIVRISTAVEDSLGLFASAAKELGGVGERENVISELLDMIGSFPTLLVLDNVETVLDDRIPTFLRDIPVGSKVLITSRIGVKTEQPLTVSGISLDDSVKLLRILGRTRGIALLTNSTDEELAIWAEQMGGRPAYIKWFAAGIQAGKLPEDLLSDNGLVLDFCMSNVFDHLTADGKAVLRSMLVVPGSHTLAELAFLNDFDAERARRVVLELTTTNFISQVRGGASGTGLELSDFARAYLLRTLNVQGDERRWLADRQRELYAIGGGLQAAYARNPYSADTIDIRGVGDYSAARRLREAIELSVVERYDEALQLTHEAAQLAPGYPEAARVEGLVHELSMNYGEAFEAYARAKDLAASDSHVAFFFGVFLVWSGFDPAAGLAELQRAAALDSASATIQLAIADAHLILGDPRAAMEAGAYAIRDTHEGSEEYSTAILKLLTACSAAAEQAAKAEEWAAMAEDIEFAVEAIEQVAPDALDDEALDLCLVLGDLAERGKNESAENYIAEKNRGLAARLTERRRRTDMDHLDRRLGWVQALVSSGGYGFIKAKDGTYFFHSSSLKDRRSFDELTVGNTLVFTPGRAVSGKRPQAADVFWVPPRALAAETPLR